MTATHTHPHISSIVEQTARRWWVHLPRGFATTGYMRHRRLRLSGQGSGRRHHALRALSSGEALSDSRHPAHTIDPFAADSEARDVNRTAARQRERLVLTACKAVAGVLLQRS